MWCWFSAADLSLHCPFLPLLFVCTGVCCFWNELRAHKLQQNKNTKLNYTHTKKDIFQLLNNTCMIYNAAHDTNRNPTSVFSTLTGSVYFSVAVPLREKKQMWVFCLLQRKILYMCLYVVGYQVLMAALHPHSQSPQTALLVHLLPCMFHSDEFVLCQSNH